MGAHRTGQMPAAPLVVSVCRALIHAAIHDLPTVFVQHQAGLHVEVPFDHGLGGLPQPVEAVGYGAGEPQGNDHAHSHHDQGDEQAGPPLAIDLCIHFLAGEPESHCSQVPFTQNHRGGKVEDEPPLR